MSRKTRITLATLAILFGTLTLLTTGAAIWWLLRGRASDFPAPPAVPVGVKLDELATRYPQIALLLRDPKVGSAIKDFIIAYNSGGPEAAKTYARESGFMNADDDITLRVLTTSDDTAQLELELKALKVQVVDKTDRELSVVIPWAVVQANVAAGRTPDAIINSISKINTVRAILPIEQNRKNTSAIGSGYQLFRPLNASISEGINKTGADRWHRAGITGKGVKIGILDPEVSKADQFIGSVLPANTKVRKTGCVTASGKSDDDDGIHGIAAAEIIHEMAPDAELFIACANGSAWNSGVDWLVGNGVKIISYSAGGVYGPRNGEGFFQRKIDDLARRGILWVNAAGNEADVFHRGRLTGADSDYSHEFSAGKTTLGVRAGGTSMHISFIWNEWSTKSPSDYDIFLFDSNGNQIASSTDDNQQKGRPDEYLFARGLVAGKVYYLQIRGSGKTLPATYLIDAYGAIAIALPTTEGSLAAPGDAKGALTVGAVVWQTDEIATYSSRGPTEDGRLKPEISAPTKVSNRVYQSAGTANFSGTSAAAPHVSGAAALIWSRNPSLSRDEVVAFLLNRAHDLGARGADTSYGYGRLDLGDPPSPSAPTGVPPVTVTPPPIVAPVSTVVGRLLTVVPVTFAPTRAVTLTPVPPSTAAIPTPPARATPVPAPAPASPNADVSWGILIGVGVLGLLGGVVLALGLMMLWQLMHAPRAVPILQPAKTVRSGICPVCNAAMSPTARFCGKCGHKL